MRRPALLLFSVCLLNVAPVRHALAAALAGAAPSAALEATQDAYIAQDSSSPSTTFEAESDAYLAEPSTTPSANGNTEENAYLVDETNAPSPTLQSSNGLYLQEADLPKDAPKAGEEAYVKDASAERLDTLRAADEAYFDAEAGAFTGTLHSADDAYFAPDDALSATPSQTGSAGYLVVVPPPTSDALDYNEQLELSMQQLHQQMLSSRRPGRFLMAVGVSAVAASVLLFRTSSSKTGSQAALSSDDAKYAVGALVTALGSFGYGIDLLLDAGQSRRALRDLERSHARQRMLEE